MSSSTTASLLGPKAERAYRTLRDRIARGEYEVGERLPTQQDLSREFAISLMTVNRAVSQLSEEGLVLTRRGAGAYVNDTRTQRPRTALLAYMYDEDGASLRQVHDAALGGGYLVTAFSQCQTEWHPDAERLFLRQVRDQRHHGLLAYCSPTEPRNDALLQEIATAGVRVLHVEHYRTELPDQAYLLPDYERAGHAAVVHLLMAGYEHIRVTVSCSYEEMPPYCELIMRGVRRALADHSTGFDPRRHFQAFPNHTDFEAKVAAQLRALPPRTGLLVLLGTERVNRVMGIARDAGLQIPGDLGIIGLDGFGDAPQVTPLGDVMSFDRPRIIQRALAHVMADPWQPPRELVAPTHIRCGTL